MNRAITSDDELFAMKLINRVFEEGRPEDATTEVYVNLPDINVQGVLARLLFDGFLEGRIDLEKLFEGTDAETTAQRAIVTGRTPDGIALGFPEN